MHAFIWDHQTVLHPRLWLESYIAKQQVPKSLQDLTPRQSLSILLGLRVLRRNVNLVKNGAIVIVTIDRTNNPARRPSLKIPYSAAMLAVAKVVDIWGIVITPIPKLALDGNFASRAPRKPLAILLSTRDAMIKPAKAASWGTRSVSTFVVIPRLSRKMGIRNP